MFSRQSQYKQELSAISNSQQKTYTRDFFYVDLSNRIFGLSQQQPSLQLQRDTSAPLFLNQELRIAIYTFNQNTGSDRDNIDHLIIRNLYRTQGELLLEMYNTLLTLNCSPTDLKTGELEYFLKAKRHFR